MRAQWQAPRSNPSRTLTAGCIACRRGGRQRQASHPATRSCGAASPGCRRAEFYPGRV